jgi:hypothetical protein
VDARSRRRSTTDQIARQARRARRFARDEQVRALYAQHGSKRPMARQLQMRRTTVIRSLPPMCSLSALNPGASVCLTHTRPLCKSAGMRAVVMVCPAGVKVRRGAFQVHAVWSPMGWCCGANSL